MKSKSKTFSGHVVRKLINETAMRTKIDLEKNLQSTNIRDKRRKQNLKRRIKSLLPFMELLGAHHILHVSRTRVKTEF